ncbi:hypothetical protein SAMN05444401_3719 [Clostridium amylolyticum]|uniref:Uncharacterized protein n=1 Tax=Clostridium amylolyticum TaxID=1121298 RepID=A0A1M6LNH6_9CLOT|nr:hypothetical protein [Clostridium amylolyticum]SHJ72744.1 hypothetical protein SAMN05444401_3719 [Clostridium amylolyticum]
MGRFYVNFENNVTKDTASGISIPVTYQYWKPLMEYFIDKCTGFRLDCWEDEKEAVDSASKLGKETESYAAKMVSFQNSISEEFIDEVLNFPLDKEGKIKWFGVNLKKDEEYLISCQHYGSEFVTGWLKDEDADFIKSILPKDFTFNVIDEE